MLLDRCPFVWRIRGLIRRLRDGRQPDPLADQVAAIGVLERDGLLRPSEAHALMAGERLADLYAEVAEAEQGVSTDELEEIEARLRAGDLAEAVVLLGRLHPALADLPHLFNRSADRARA